MSTPEGRNSAKLIVLGDKKVRDITKEFRSASQELPVGNLIKDDFFTLFESVGALEIMDPKMDSGLLTEGESLDPDYNVKRPIIPTELLGIMDQLLCCEMAWHQGYPLSQTIFASHYIDNLLMTESRQLSELRYDAHGSKDSPPEIVNCVVRAYCLAMIRCCSLTIDQMNLSPFYEDEDFFVHTFGRDILARQEPSAILEELEDAITWVSETTTVPELSTEVRSAILCRLEIRKLLLHVMLTQEHLFYRVESCQILLKLLPDLQETHKLGKIVPNACSPKIQRRLASTVPPRPMIELTFNEAHSTLMRMLVEIQAASLVDEIDFTKPLALKMFLHSFSARKPEPLPYSRAFLSQLLFRGDRDYDLLLRADLSECVFGIDGLLQEDIVMLTGSGVSTSSSTEKSAILRNFGAVVLNAYHDIYRYLCGNRCRFRRNLCHTIVDLDDSMRIAAHAADLDMQLKKANLNSEENPFTTFVYLLKVQCMEWIIQLGFELDVFLPYELSGMYFTLEWLARKRFSLFKREDPGIDFTSPNSSICKSHQRVRNCLKTGSLATWALASALRHIYTLLLYLGGIETPALGARNNPERRYELRMKPFWNIRYPKILSYEEFRDEVYLFGPIPNKSAEFPQEHAEALTKMAEEAVKGAQATLSRHKSSGAALDPDVGGQFWAKELEKFQKSCIAAGIASATLRKFVVHRKDKRLSVRIPPIGSKDRYHEWWAVPIIILEE